MRTIPATFPDPCKHVHGLTTTREFGFSTSPYDKGNMSYQVHDNPTHVSQNREQLTRLLPQTPFWMEQSHGCHVITIDEHADPSVIPEGDAMITGLYDKPLCIQTADCLPILMTDKKQHIVAAIHAGWRGLIQNIIQLTYQAMNACPADLSIWIGPAISQAHFICQEDVVSSFTQHIPQPNQWLVYKDDQAHIDLFAATRTQCLSNGISSISVSGYCTYENAQQFYSYRRDGIRTGRMATVIWQTQRR